jgi:GNAT superfamily N-acetyltransferase
VRPLGGPLGADVDRELILDLERCGSRALPAAETVTIGEWMVAIGRGTVGRLNSCTTFGDSPRRDMFERIESVERRYDGRGRETRFRLTPLDVHLDGRLETRGYERSEDVIVMTGPVGGVIDGEVAVARAAGRTWLDRYSTWGGHEEIRTNEIGESLGSLTLDYGAFSSPAAIGVAVLDPPWVGIFDVIVDPAARGEGHGRRLTETMLAWAKSAGAERSYLQVHSVNQPAIALYNSLGFTETYRYWYRTL